MLLRESLFDRVVIRTSLYVHDSCVGRYSSHRGPLMTDRMSMSVSLVTEVGPCVSVHCFCYSFIGCCVEFVIEGLVLDLLLCRSDTETSMWRRN